jgi:hypothetical protein
MPRYRLGTHVPAGWHPLVPRGDRRLARARVPGLDRAPRTAMAEASCGAPTIARPRRGSRWVLPALVLRRSFFHVTSFTHLVTSSAS